MNARWKALVACLMLMLASRAAQASVQETVKYIHTDALGSIVAVTNANGQVIERRAYEPYGAQLLPDMQDGPGYTGHVQDAATGLVYMQQRYYDPQIGRFLSIDPVAAGPGLNFNRYSYAANNPYRFTDPDGRDCVSVDGVTRCRVPVTGSRIPVVVSFPTPPGVSGIQKTGSSTSHVYDVRTSHRKSDRSVQQSIVNDPTPGNDRPATPTGTPNNATPTKGGRALLAKFGSLLPGGSGDSPVNSYSATDQSGNTWVINVTQPGHGLHFGYVLRGSVGGQAISIGEGWAIPQAIPVLSGYINNVWIDHNQRNVDDAH